MSKKTWIVPNPKKTENQNNTEVNWDNIKNKPENFPVEQHEHSIKDIPEIFETINDKVEEHKYNNNAGETIVGHVTLSDVPDSNLDNTKGVATTPFALSKVHKELLQEISDLRNAIIELGGKLD